MTATPNEIDAEEMTDHDLLVEIIGMCLNEPNTSGQEILTMLEQLDAGALIAEAREMQDFLAAEEVSEPEEDGEPPALA